MHYLPSLKIALLKKVYCFLLVNIILGAMPFKLIADNQLEKFTIIAKEVDSLSKLHGTKARLLLKDLYQIAGNHPDSIVLKQECLYREAELGYAQGVYDSTINRLIKKELQYINPLKDTFHNAMLQYSFALNQYLKGSYGEAFTLALYAMEQFEQLKNNQFTIKTLMILGRICISIESYKMAEEYYNKALEYMDRLHPDYYQIRSNIVYITLVRSGHLEAATDSLIKYISIFEAKQDTAQLIGSYLNISSIYHLKNEHEKTRYYYTATHKLIQAIDNVRYSVVFYQGFGVYQIMENNLRAAYQNFHLAKTFAENSGSPDLLIFPFESLAHIHEKLNHIDSAYFYVKQYNAVKEKILKEANPIEAYRSYISVFLEASKQELIIKEQEILLKNRLVIVMTISAVGIILLIVSWLIILQQQKRHSHQQALLKETENKELEERLQSKLLSEQLQTERINAQTRELTSYSLALSNKNSILQQISSAIQRLPNDPRASDDIQKMIKNNLNIDGAWEDFVLHFEKVHPSFFNRIKTICNTLSENDLRLCAYFRIGMLAKQIAQILNVSPESIKMHRYRIKKKLNLSEDENLDDFIRNI